MADWANAEWVEWDQAARGELTAVLHPFDRPGKRGRTERSAMLQVFREGTWIGSVTVRRTQRDWLLETVKIRLDESHHFRKDVHADGGYQPRWGLFLMEHLFDAFPGMEIRESPAVNDPAGIPFVARVRAEYGLPYHRPACFRSDDEGDDGECVCGAGRLRALAPSDPAGGSEPGTD